MRIRDAGVEEGVFPLHADARALPFAAGTFAIASFASMGLPGFSGFVAELQVLVGAWRPVALFLR